MSNKQNDILEENVMEFMQEQVCDFITENPMIIKAMAQGAKVQLYFDLPPKEEKSIKVEADVIFPKGNKMTLAELFKTQ